MWEVFEEEGHLANLGNGGTLDGVDNEHAAQDVLGLLGDVRWHRVDTALNLLEEGRNVVVVEWQLAAQQHIHDDTSTPNVDFWARVEPAS